jgi:hypothetical protein
MKQVADISAKKRSLVVEEFGALDAEVTAFKPKKDRHEQLRKEMQGWHENSPASQAFTEESENYTVVIGERANERAVTNMKGLIRYLGSAAAKLLRINLKDFDENVPLPDRQKFLTEGQTGSRKVKVIPKTLAKAA